MSYDLDSDLSGIPDNAGGFPLNRIISFAGPYLAVLSGALADWLLVHVHFLAIFHTTHSQVANAITQVTVFGITALLTFAYHHRWLIGWQNWESQVIAPQKEDPTSVPSDDVLTETYPGDAPVPEGAGKPLS